MPCARVQAAPAHRAWAQAEVVASLGADGISGGMVGAAGPVVAWHSKLCLPLLFVLAVLVRLPDRCHGQLRRADARCFGSALPAARRAAVRRRGQWVARLRLGLSVRVPAGPSRP